MWLGDASPRTAPSERVRRLGFVAQVPGDQLVAGTVGDELAFAMESAGLPGPDMDARSRALLAQVGLDLRTWTATRSALRGTDPAPGRPPPLSRRVRARCCWTSPWPSSIPPRPRPCCTACGAWPMGAPAVLLVEHRVAACLPFVDRVREMAEGRLLPERATHAVAREAAAQAEAALGSPPPGRAPGGARIDVQQLRFRYPGSTEDALQDIHLRLHAGERVALVGANGAGKSTLLGCLSGALRPEGLKQPDSLVAVPQDPDLALFCESVRAELAWCDAARGPLPRRGRPSGAAGRRSALDLLPARPPPGPVAGPAPAGGRGGRLTCDPAVLLLDEPTAGQDLHQVGRIFAGLATALPEALLVFATHDLRLARRWATRVLRSGGGESSKMDHLKSFSGRSQPGRTRCDRPPQPTRRGGLCRRLRHHPGPPPQPAGAQPALHRGLGSRPSPARLAAFGLWLAGAVIWGTVLSQGLFYAEQPRVALLSVGPLRIWREGLQHGLVQSLRLVAMAFAGAALTLSTPPDRLHAALLRLRLPFGLALMASTALRLVPELAGGWRWCGPRGPPAARLPLDPGAATSGGGAELALLRPVVAPLPGGGRSTWPRAWTHAALTPSASAAPGALSAPAPSIG